MRPILGALASLHSRPPGEERLDLEPARRIIGYEPRNTWPEGLSFPVE